MTHGNRMSLAKLNSAIKVKIGFIIVGGGGVS